MNNPSIINIWGIRLAGAACVLLAALACGGGPPVNYGSRGVQPHQAHHPSVDPTSRHQISLKSGHIVATERAIRFSAEIVSQSGSNPPIQTDSIPPHWWGGLFARTYPNNITNRIDWSTVGPELVATKDNKLEIQISAADGRNDILLATDPVRHRFLGFSPEMGAWFFEHAPIQVRKGQVLYWGNNTTNSYSASKSLDDLRSVFNFQFVIINEQRARDVLENRVTALIGDVLKETYTIIPEDAISRVQIQNADIRISPKQGIPEANIDRLIKGYVDPASQSVRSVRAKLLDAPMTASASGYNCRLIRGVQYSIQIRHPQYQFTEAVFTADSSKSTIRFLIGDRGSRVRVVME